MGEGEEYRSRNDQGVRRTFWIYQRPHKMPLKLKPEPIKWKDQYLPRLSALSMSYPIPYEHCKCNGEIIAGSYTYMTE